MSHTPHIYSFISFIKNDNVSPTHPCVYIYICQYDIVSAIHILSITPYVSMHIRHYDVRTAIHILSHLTVSLYISISLDIHLIPHFLVNLRQFDVRTAINFSPTKFGLF